MTLVVTFAGVSALSSGPADSVYRVWSYSIEPTADADLVAGHKLALALPADVDVQSPGAYPTETALAGTFLEHGADASRQYVGRLIAAAGPQTISFVAPKGQAARELFLVTRTSEEPWAVSRFATSATGSVGNAHLLPAPVAPALPVFQGRPVSDFAGTLPYATELFGVYQPLAGWKGFRNMQWLANRLPPGSRDLQPERFRWQDIFHRGGHQDAILLHPGSEGFLSPIGMINLFRECFFELDTFLGAPSGHIWISPGGTVEVIEVSTRRTLVEKTAEQSVDTTRKVEEDLTQQDDLADAVKEDNANDTKLGVSASGGGGIGVYHAEASGSFSSQNTVKKSAEETHKHTRTQSSKVSSEIHRNFKTTFRTVTENTDTTSRRYVVQNTTQQLVNYELRRKMRKVGVQVWHIGTRLSWQVYVDDPGRNLGLGELVHVVSAPDLTSLQKPEAPPPLQPKETEFSAAFVLQRFPETKNDPHQDANYTRSGEAPAGGTTGMHSDNNDDHIVGDFDYQAPPPAPGWTISSIRQVSAKTQGGDAQFLAHYDSPKGSTGSFRLKAQFLNFGGGRIITFTVAVTWAPPSPDPAQTAYQTELIAYEAQVAALQREEYAKAVRERLSLVSEMRPRPSSDMRSEERQTVYGNLIEQLELFPDTHIGSELIRQIFDVDEMLYFTAPDYWRPKPKHDPKATHPLPQPQPKNEPWSDQHPNFDTLGRYPTDPVLGPAETVATRYTKTDTTYAIKPDLTTPQPDDVTTVKEARVNYLITEATQPAPPGSSLGWLIQMDGDERRNEFLNAAWAKAVLPIRPGHEVEALEWLAAAEVQGEDNSLDQDYLPLPGDPPEYKNKSLRQVLNLLAQKLQADNTDINNILATEKVFENGFDPLDGGFRPAEPFKPCDQWIEVLPTDQIVAVDYDPTIHGA